MKPKPALEKDWPVFASFGIIILFFIIWRLIERFRSKHGRIRDSPRGHVNLTSQHKVGPVVFHCSTKKRPKASEKEQERDIWRLRSILTKRYGTGEDGVWMPCGIKSQLVAVQIPANNFQCGAGCNEFVPRCGGATGSWTYQTIASSFEVTMFTVDGKTYTAGVCIDATWVQSSKYVREIFSRGGTYEPPIVARKSVQKRFCLAKRQVVVACRSEYGETSKFRFDGAADDLKPVECCCWTCDPSSDPKVDDAPGAPTLQNLSHLQVEFCPIAKKPVMIGRDPDDVIVHYIWSREASRFETESCERCGAMEGNTTGFTWETLQGDDWLPTYKYLELLGCAQ